MSTPEITRRDMELLEASPLRGSRQVHRAIYPDGSGKYLQISCRRFPWLFKDPDILALYQSTLGEPKTEGLYTAYHTTQEFDFKQLVEYFNDPILPEVLLFRQCCLMYPGRTVKKISFKRYDWGGYPPEVQSNEVYLKPSNFTVGRYFAFDDQAPNKEIIYPTGNPDMGMNMYLALLLSCGKIIKKETSDPVSNMEDLNELTYAPDLRVDPQLLYRGFQNLVSEKTLWFLWEKDILTEDRIEEFYRNAAEWHLELTEEIQKDRRGSGDIFPHSFELASDLQPPLAFLPYVALNTLRYFIDLPQLIQEGQCFDHAALLQGFKRLYSYVEGRLIGELAKTLSQSTDNDLPSLYKLALDENPALANDVKQIRDFVSSLRNSFQQVFVLYQRNPHLLNRRNPAYTADVNLTNFARLREEALRAGGRAPRKPFYYRVKYHTKHNQV